MPGSENLTLLVRLDADHHVGLAHAVRMAKILSLSDIQFTLHLIGHLPEYDKFFDPDTEIHALTATSEQDKAREVLATATRIKAHILMVDQPHLTKVSWDIFTKATLPVIAIDDEGGPVQADLIFNGTILPAYHHYPEEKTRSEIYCGGEYALLNPCFAQNSWADPVEKSLLTVIGSGDRAADWALTLTAPDGPLTKLKIPKKTLICGAAFPAFVQLEKNCHKGNITLHRGIDQSSMAEMFRHHTAGLITGGMIVYEALACGLPVMVFPQEKNLPPEAEFFAARECLIDLGYDGGMDMALVARAITKMVNSPEKRLTLSKNAQQTIDGKGMARVTKILNQFIQREICP